MAQLVRPLRISPIADLKPIVAQGEVVALNVGHDGLAYMAIAELPRDHLREEQTPESWKAYSDTLRAYRVVALSDRGVALDTAIKATLKVHHVQPLPGGQLLLVSSRSHHREGEPTRATRPHNHRQPWWRALLAPFASGSGLGDTRERNGRVYGRDGDFLRDMFLGDAIADVQTTQGGTIWTSFWDEAVDEPFCLAAWDESGKRLSEVEPDVAALSIPDACYAMNVTSETSVWFYGIYLRSVDGFSLVHLSSRKVDRTWELPFFSSDFAVSGEHALFQVKDEDDWDRPDTYRLVALRPGGQAQVIARFQFQDMDGHALRPDQVVGRGDALYMVCGHHLYSVRVRTVVALVGKGTRTDLH